MRISADQNVSNRRPVNLTIREDILTEAKSLRLNTSKAAEAGIVQAIKAARAQNWLDSNRSALLAHNERIEEAGPLLTPSWVDE